MDLPDLSIPFPCFWKNSSCFLHISSSLESSTPFSAPTDFSSGTVLLVSKGTSKPSFLFPLFFLLFAFSLGFSPRFSVVDLTGFLAFSESSYIFMVVGTWACSPLLHSWRSCRKSFWKSKVPLNRLTLLLNLCAVLVLKQPVHIICPYVSCSTGLYCCKW